MATGSTGVQNSKAGFQIKFESLKYINKVGEYTVENNAELNKARNIKTLFNLEFQKKTIGQNTIGKIKILYIYVYISEQIQ